MELLFGKTIEDWKLLGAGYTAKEIRQQPILWLETLQILEVNKELLEPVRKFLADHPSARIILSGAGSSAYIGEVAAPLLRKKTKRRVEAIPTTDIVPSPKEYFEGDQPTLLVSFARSGNSPESLATYDLANQEITTIHHLVITCNSDGALAQKATNQANANLLLMPVASNDQGFAMTGSFSCMLLAVLLFFEADLVSRKDELKKISLAGAEILEKNWNRASTLVQQDFSRIVVLGSATFHGLAKEGALKCLELASGKRVAMAESTMGFRHGPKSIIADGTVIIQLLSDDPHTRRYEFDLLNELQHDQGKKILIGLDSKNDSKVASRVDQLWFGGGDSSSELSRVLLYLLQLQLFSLFLSIHLAIEPDNPRPDGTVNRVVQGVTIHTFA